MAPKAMGRWSIGIWIGAGLLLLPSCHGGSGGSPPTQPDFALSATPASLSIPAGGGGFVTVTATRSNGFAEAIQVSLAGAPAGVAGSATLPAGSGSLQLSILVARSLAPQVLANLSLTGTSGSLARSTPFALTIAAALPAGSISPDSVQASGGPQQGGGLSNTAIAGEPVAASTTQAGGTAVRHGFKPSSSN